MNYVLNVNYAQSLPGTHLYEEIDSGTWHSVRVMAQGLHAYGMAPGMPRWLP